MLPVPLSDFSGSGDTGFRNEIPVHGDKLFLQPEVLARLLCFSWTAQPRLRLEVALYIGALLHMDSANFNDGLNYPSDGLISICHDLQTATSPRLANV